jgi:hypothetical protein
VMILDRFSARMFQKRNGAKGRAILIVDTNR